MSRALITGITGQDGSYLAEFLLDKGYEVHGLIRRSSTENTDRIRHLIGDPARVTLHYGDMTDAGSLSRLLYKIGPDEVYNLAAQSHVKVSFDIPKFTADVNAVGTLMLLDSIRVNPELNSTRLPQVSCSEKSGNTQNENTLLSEKPLCGKQAVCILDNGKLQGIVQFVCLQR